MSTALRPRPRLDLLAIVALGALATLAVILAPGAVALRAALGLPFLLVGPGYAVMLALFAGARPDVSMQALLTLGLGIAAIVLVGLGLDAVGIALTARSLAVAVFAVTGVACVLAELRMPHRAGSTGVTAARALRSPWLWSVATLLAVFAALLAALARPLPDQSFAGYTQLSALRGEPRQVRIAVQSAEHVRTTYRLVASAASGRTDRRTFTLAPGQRWERVVHTGPPAEQTVHVRLYRAGAPDAVYREVVLRA